MSFSLDDIKKGDEATRHRFYRKREICKTQTKNFTWKRNSNYFIAWQISRFTSAQKRGRIDSDETALSCTVYKIPWFSEMCRFQSGILAVIPNRNQLSTQQGHYIYGVFFGTKEDPANMSCHSKINLIFIFCLPLFDNCKINQCFGHVISNQFCPDLLFDIFRFGRMKIT